MTDCEKYIRERLFELRDEEYGNFHSKLMPTVERSKIIGVRTPNLRKLANEISKTPYAKEFLSILPHEYYEENNLHAFLIEKIRNFDECMAYLNAFLPFVDNWATCDMMRPKIFKKNLSELERQIEIWLDSKESYTIRFAIGMLMTFYLDERFSPEYPAAVAKIKSDEYYVEMMQAWYFATALAKQYDEVISYLEQNKLSLFVHNKTIRKAVESYRISDEKKIYLRTLKRDK